MEVVGRSPPLRHGNPGRNGRNGRNERNELWNTGSLVRRRKSRAAHVGKWGEISTMPAVCRFKVGDCYTVWRCRVETDTLCISWYHGRHGRHQGQVRQQHEQTGHVLAAMSSVASPTRDGSGASVGCSLAFHMSHCTTDTRQAACLG